MRWGPSCIFHLVRLHQLHHLKYIGTVYKTKSTLNSTSSLWCIFTVLVHEMCCNIWTFVYVPAFANTQLLDLKIYFYTKIPLISQQFTVKHNLIVTYGTFSTTKLPPNALNINTILSVWVLTNIKNQNVICSCSTTYSTRAYNICCSNFYYNGRYP